MSETRSSDPAAPAAAKTLRDPTAIYRLNPAFYKLFHDLDGDLEKIHGRLHQVQIRSPQDLQGIPEFVAKALRHFPDNLVLNFVSACLATDGGRPLTGLMGFKKVLGLFSPGTDQVASALFVTDLLLDQFPTDVNLIERKAELLAEAGRTEESIRILAQGGRHYSQEKQQRLALQCYWKGIQLFQDSDVLAYGAVTAILEYPSFRAGIEALNKLMPKAPQNVYLYYLRGLLLTRAGREEDAETDFTLATELSKDRIATLTLLHALMRDHGPRDMLERFALKLKIMDPSGIERQAALTALVALDPPPLRRVATSPEAPSDPRATPADPGSASAAASHPAAPVIRPGASAPGAGEEPGGERAGPGRDLVRWVLVAVVLVAGGAFFYPAYVGYLEEQAALQIKTDQDVLRTAVAEMSRVGTQHSENTFHQLVTRRHIAQLPVDPWDQEYVYDFLLQRIISRGPNRMLETPVPGMESQGSPPGDDLVASAVELGEALAWVRAGDPGDQLVRIPFDGTPQGVIQGLVGRVLRVDGILRAGRILSVSRFDDQRRVYLYDVQKESSTVIPPPPEATWVSAAFLDPEGRRLVAAWRRPGVARGDGVSVLDLENQTWEPWVDGLEGLESVSASPGSTGAIYSAPRQGKLRAFRIEGPGTTPVPLCDVGEEQSRPALSPDGRLLASNQRVGPEEVVTNVIDLATQEKMFDIADIIPGTGPVWSPNGDRLLVATQGGSGIGLAIVHRLKSLTRVTIPVEGIGAATGYWKSRGRAASVARSESTSAEPGSGPAVPPDAGEEEEEDGTTGGETGPGDEGPAPGSPGEHGATGSGLPDPQGPRRNN